MGHPALFVGAEAEQHRRSNPLREGGEGFADAVAEGCAELGLL
jgi:hypothetical protein